MADMSTVQKDELMSELRVVITEPEKLSVAWFKQVTRVRVGRWALLAIGMGLSGAGWGQGVHRELEAKFRACESCQCKTSEPLEARLPVGRVYVKLLIDGWTPTNHTGYPAWLSYNARRRNGTDWTGWAESLEGISELRIEGVVGKLTPPRPKPGDKVLFEAEYNVNAAIDVQFQISSQRYYDGSGSCNQVASTHWLTVSTDPAVVPVVRAEPTERAPSTGSAAVQGVPQAMGSWREVDGACEGTTWRIVQDGDKVTALSAQITCGNGYRASWKAENIRWQSPGVLAYDIRLSSGVVERQVTTFTAAGAATVDVYPLGQQQKSATVHLRKLDVALPAASGVGGNWREVDGACQGTTWRIVQDGDKVTALSAQITCGNGYRASWKAENIRWQSPGVLAYDIRLSSGVVERQVTTFTAAGAATVDVYPLGQQQKSATVHIRQE